MKLKLIDDKMKHAWLTPCMFIVFLIGDGLPLSVIIDTHAHVFPDKIAEKATESIGGFYDIPMDLVGSVSELLSLSKTYHISKMLIHSVATSPAQIESINNFIAETISQYPDLFIGFGTLHPDMDAPEQEIDRCISIGLKGIKLHPDFQKFEADSDKAKRIYASMEGRLPLLIHAGDHRYDYSHPRRIANIVDSFPKLDVIAAHFGGWSQWMESTKYLGGKRVWVDTSSSLYQITPEEAKSLIDSYGEDYVLFGSDFPMWNVGDELERLKKLNLSEIQMEKILHLNAEKLLKL